jgi:hypothetical protein
VVAVPVKSIRAMLGFGTFVALPVKEPGEVKLMVTLPKSGENWLKTLEA